jgi:hypothetical protein
MKLKGFSRLKSLEDYQNLLAPHDFPGIGRIKNVMPMQKPPLFSRGL